MSSAITPGPQTSTNDFNLASFHAMSAILKIRTSTFPSKHCDKHASLYLSFDVMTLCDILFRVSIEP